MPAPSTVDDFLELIRKSYILEPPRLETYLQNLQAEAPLPARPKELAGRMLKDGLLTQFQARQLLIGKWRGFMFGKFKVLEQLGTGGMSSVYLCEHLLMRRHVAVKVLPISKSQEDATVARFYREARAAAALNHPNIARAFDVDRDGQLHFIVMEYVDGSSLYDIVRKHGQMDVFRACHYIRQAAIGLQHIHENQLVHRDIKPGNLMVDRQGIIKILDLGLARFFSAHSGSKDELTENFDKHAMMGTADYISPEQAMDLHEVDIRADIYSLGATLYFLLAAQPPFQGKSITQKLMLHQMKTPEPVTTHRADVPAELAAVIDRMMRKEPGDRYQTPAEVAEALSPWTQTAIGPPPEKEMPKLCLAAVAPSPAEGGPLPTNLSGSSIRRMKAAGRDAGSRAADQPGAVPAAVRDPLCDTSETYLPVARPSDTVTEVAAEADTKVNPKKSTSPTAPSPAASSAEGKTQPVLSSHAAKRRRLKALARMRSLGTLILLVLSVGLIAGVGGGVLVWTLMSHGSGRTQQATPGSHD
jgi:serine/threonine protein kinase